jgi:hypothetical protein
MSIVQNVILHTKVHDVYQYSGHSQCVKLSICHERCIQIPTDPLHVGESCLVHIKEDDETRVLIFWNPG